MITAKIIITIIFKWFSKLLLLNLYLFIIIWFYPMVGAQQSPKQRQISGSVLLLLLWLGKTTSFPVCGSVHIKYIVFHHLIMREFFNYSATLSVSPLQRSSGPAPCSALKLQPVGVDGRQSMPHSGSGTHGHPVESRDFTGFTEAVVERSTTITDTQHLPM